MLDFLITKQIVNWTQRMATFIFKDQIYLKKKTTKKNQHKHKIHHTSFVMINHELKYNLYTTPIILPHKNHTWINVYIFFLLVNL